MADRNVLINENTMTNIAEAIRSKTGKSNKILPADMPSEIVSIPTNNSGDFLLQDVRISPSKYEKTVYPEGGYYGFSSATVDAVTSSIDSNIKSENIKSGVTILDVQGSYEGTGGIDTSDATASKTDILSGKTAYVKGSKVTGTMNNNGSIDGTIDGLTKQSYTIPSGYTSGGSVVLTNDIKNALSQITDETTVTEQIDGISNEVDTQADLIDQIITNLNGKIASGENGITPSGQLEITANGTYDVTNYASAKVNVDTSGGNSGTDEMVTVTFNAPPFTSLIGYIDGNTNSQYIDGPIGDTQLQIRKNTLLTFIDESNIGFYGVSVTDGINFVAKSFSGSTSSPYFYVAFDITKNCTIVLD